MLERLVLFLIKKIDLPPTQKSKPRFFAIDISDLRDKYCLKKEQTSKSP